MLHPVIAFLLKFGALAVAAGALAVEGFHALFGQVSVETVGGAFGVAGFAAATSVALYRLLKDNKLTENAESQRDYERDRANRLAEELSDAQRELGRYRSTYGPLD